MNAHKRHGYSSNDVLDFEFWTRHGRSPSARRRPIFVNLGLARTFAVNARHSRGGTMPGFHTREDNIRFAREHIERARAWRLELRGE